MNGHGFQKLRIAAATTGTALLSLFGAVTRTARASTNLPLTYASSTRWQVQSSNCAERFGLPGNQCGIGLRQYTEVNDTSVPTTYVPPPTTYMPPSTTSTSSTTFTPPSTTYTPPSTTSTPPTTDSWHSTPPRTSRIKKDMVSDIRAFNNSLGLSVGNKIFKAPNGRVDLTAGTVTAGPEMFGGLSANVQYQFFGSTKTARATFVLTNTTDSAIDIDIRTNIGGFGGDATIAASSPAENEGSVVNRWYETVGSSGGEAPSVLFVACGADGQRAHPSMSKISPSNGMSDYVNRYEFDISPGDTIGIMVFAQANAVAPSATTVDTTFASLSTLDSAGLLTNLPLARNKILNWNGPERRRLFSNWPPHTTGTGAHDSP